MSDCFFAWVVRGLALLLSGGACNALFSIEEGVLVPDDGQGGGAPDVREVVPELNGGGAAGSPPPGGGSGTNAQGGSSLGGGSGLPPDVMIDPLPLTFSARNVSHSLVTGRLNAIHSLGSAITPDCAAPTCFSAQAGSEVCVSASTEIVPNGDFVTYWGAQLLIELEDGGAVPARPPWDRAGGRVRGLSFRITGSALDNLSFDVRTPATADEMYPDYGVALPASSGVQHDISFESLKKPRWLPAATTTLPDTLPLVSFIWHMASAADRARTFDFCISEIRPIVAVE